MRTVLYVVELGIFFPLVTGILTCTSCAMLLTHHSVQGSIIDHTEFLHLCQLSF